MNVKILKILSMLFALTILTACSTKVEYIDRIKEVYIPIPCESTMPACNFKKETDTEIIGELFNCIGLLKIELRRCIEI